MDIGNVDQVTLPALGLGVVGIGTLTVAVVMIIKRLFEFEGRLAYAVTGAVSLLHALMALVLVVYPSSEMYVGGYVLAIVIWLFASGFYVDNVKRPS